MYLTPKSDPAEIIRSLKIILEPGQITELRALDAVTPADRRPHVESGYFDDFEKLAAAVSTIKSAKGIYIIPNPINPALLARASNRIRPVGREPTTADHDIAQRRWLLVDCDAKRPAGISASDDEHHAAHAAAQRIAGELAREGWPAPIYAGSGNGAHLLFRIDLPADDGGLVQRVLQGLADRFDTDEVTIDTAVYNPARIWKLYGSIAAKGDSTPERPHRMARIIKAPTELIVVETVLLEAVAATARSRVQPDQFMPTSQSFDLERWIHEHQLDVDGPAQWQGGRKWVFRTCPWNSDHTNRSAYLLQQPSGAIAAGCHHNGCQDKGWHELRNLIEPGWRERKNITKIRPSTTAAATKPIERRPFPVEVLPAPVANYISEAATAIGCDLSYVGLVLLACLARAIGNTRVIRLKRSWVEAAIIWAAIIGKSGTHKSPALRAAVTSLEHKQAEAIAEYAEAVARYEQERAQYERDYLAWKRSKSTEPPPWEPKEPHCRRYICNDVTIEALAALLDGQQDGVLVVRDELAGWVDGIGEYKKGGKGSDTGHWLACWSGAPMTVDRKTGQRMIHVPRAAVSIVGGIQPGILRRAIGREHLQDGLCARLLLAMPAPRQVTWSEATISPGTEAAIADVFGKLLSLDPAADEDGNPTPFAMALTPEAKTVWVAYFNQHRAEMVGMDDDLRAAWSKLEAYAARLALIVQLCSWAAGEGSDDQIDQASIEAGIVLSDWFGVEARRVYDLLSESDEEREQRELAELISRQGGTITARQLAHSSRAYRASGEAEAALERLAKVGWGHWSVDADTGGRPANVFVLNSGHGNTTPENAEERRLPLPLPRSADELDDVNIRLAEAAEEDQAA
jgi:hypothetical protein